MLHKEMSLKYIIGHEIKQIEYSMAFITIAICTIAIVFSFLLLAFNIRLRNFRLIKMSSPNINNIINLSCILLYLCPIFNSIKGLNILNEPLGSSFCQINVLIIPVCSTAIYSAMLLKAWRIYRIFDTSPKMKKVVIKDLRLVFYIILMVSLDLLVVFVWLLVDTIKLKPRLIIETHPTKLKNNSFTDSFKTLAHNQTYSNHLKLVFECNSDYNEVWITILTLYKLCIFMYGIYLAWITRNINVPSMNDSKYLLLSTYTITICGLGSMTLSQLLRDWPDVVQFFFSIGIISATSITQCLVFIPKIRLWYKKRHDDEFKITLSQIFFQTPSNYYKSDKQNKNLSNNPTKSLTLEDELYELLHENSQLKSFLKEKEEVIKILHEKIRSTKANLFQANELHNKLTVEDFNNKVDLPKYNSSSSIISDPTKRNITTNFTTLITSNQDSGLGNDSSITTSNSFNNQSSLFTKTANDRLKSDLDEVEELTTRVRNSISVDLSNTRRYSPLLYEYYRKQIELARSIQCTYNIQCNTLFDAMTLMKKCLKDYCQTVHNPEYLAIDAICKETNQYSQFNFNDYLAKNMTRNSDFLKENKSILNVNRANSFNVSILNTKSHNEFLNNTFLTNLSTEPSSSANSISSSTSLSKQSNNLSNISNVDNKQTYV